VELEVLTKLQAKKNTEREMTYTNWQHKKDNVIGSYRRLAVKHSAFMWKVQ
jgi:hypothetical protein